MNITESHEGLFLSMFYLYCVPKNETRLILNILYYCKSIAMKFSTWYPDDLSC